MVHSNPPIKHLKKLSKQRIHYQQFFYLQIDINTAFSENQSTDVIFNTKSRYRKIIYDSTLGYIQ